MDIRNLLYAFYDVEMPIETPTSPGDTAPEPYSVMDLPRMMRPTALQPEEQQPDTIVISVLKTGEADEAAREAGLSTIIEEENECSVGTLHFPPFNGFLSNRGLQQQSCTTDSIEERPYIVIQHTEEEMSDIQGSDNDF